VADTKNWSYLTYRTVWQLLDLLIPPVCGGCERLGERWCKECQGRVKILSGIICEKCGLPQEETGVCDTCLADQPHYHALKSWAVFDEPLQPALHKLKYRRDISLGDSLGFQMLPFVKDLDWQIDMILPVPLGAKRLKQRGYNQVGMIAKPLSIALGIEYTPGELVRRTETRSQVGLTKLERKLNVRNAFKAGSKVDGKRILVMDDVATTGATLSSAAEALYDAGAAEVNALTVARALPHHGLERA